MYGKTCHNCQRQHHFLSMCRSQKKVHGPMSTGEEYDCESTLFVGAVTTEVQIQNDVCYVTLPVQGHLTRLKVDTGSQVNIIPLKELKKIAGDNPHIDPCNQILVSYSENELKVLGTGRLYVKSKLDADQELT